MMELQIYRIINTVFVKSKLRKNDLIIVAMLILSGCKMLIVKNNDDKAEESDFLMVCSFQ